MPRPSLASPRSRHQGSCRSGDTRRRVAEFAGCHWVAGAFRFLPIVAIGGSGDLQSRYGRTRPRVTERHLADRACRDAAGSADYRRHVPTLEAALCAAAAGDPQAMGSVYDASCGPAWRLALCLVGDGDRASQLMVTTYAEVWARANEGARSPLTPQTWVLTLLQQGASECPDRPAKPAGPGDTPGPRQRMLGLKRRLAAAVAGSGSGPPPDRPRSSRRMLPFIGRRSRRLRRAIDEGTPAAIVTDENCTR